MCFQLCGNSLEKTFFRINITQLCAQSRVQFGGEDHDWPTQCPDLNPVQHLWDEVEHHLQGGRYCRTSVLELSNVFVDERKQISAARCRIFWNSCNQESGGCCTLTTPRNPVCWLWLCSKLYFALSSVIICNDEGFHPKFYLFSAWDAVVPFGSWNKRNHGLV